MKKIIALAVLFVFVFTNTVWATGACVFASIETYGSSTKNQKKSIDFTCTSDASGIAAFSFVPATYGVKGWYLYNVTTDPDGTSAPTADYDITCLATGENVCGTLLGDRSATARQTVSISPATLGFHITDGTIAFTFANITSNPGIFVMTLRFAEN